MQAFSNHPYFQTFTADVSEEAMATFLPKLKGKVVVITGACSSIGLSIAELFIAHGARVVAGDIEMEMGLESENRFRDAFVFQYCDPTKEEDIKRLVHVAAERFLGIDILVNNFGAAECLEEIRRMNGDGWSTTMKLIMPSTALAMRHAVPFMEMRGGGSIINMAPIAGLQMNKALLLSRLFAVHLGRSNIRINVVSSSFACDIYHESVKGPRVPGCMMQRVKTALAKSTLNLQPISRAKALEKIAQVCLFLASDESCYITGAKLTVSDGMTAHNAESDLEAWEIDIQALLLPPKL